MLSRILTTLLLAATSFALHALPQQALVPGGVAILGIDNYRPGTEIRFDGRKTTLYEVEGKKYALAGIPLKTHLGYYKPYSIDRGKKLKFLQGEIDFLFSLGKQTIPIEVKAAVTRAGMELKTLKQFIKDQNIPFGVIFYSGMPYYDQREELLYWPYWLI